MARSSSVNFSMNRDEIIHMKTDVHSEKPEVMHQPKGSMCASCVRSNSDCSDLDFDLMPVLNRCQQVVVVRCTEWKKRS